MPGKITLERLKEVLRYDPETGVWIWWNPTANCMNRGDIAGRIDSSGYRQITIDGRAYLAARLAFFRMTGRWPSEHIDHRDMNSLNDRWLNLREATRSQNFANQHAYKNNKLGIKGVHLSKRGKYVCSIQVRGKKIMVGFFDTPELAAAAYKAAAELHFGEFARTA